MFANVVRDVWMHLIDGFWHWFSGFLRSHMNSAGVEIFAQWNRMTTKEII